ncbi:hypothetical protein ND860_04110 [Leptospira levettii]|uniref:LA_3150 family lipoprotein n=1 Tax=Leptospira levettii TaxID=2023178 RepID=UPI00223D4711|nr:hypothetical protein [Leptospira levettii]MCW7495697.1 hypothetical protein [Leptospira levettii]
MKKFYIISIIVLQMYCVQSKVQNTDGMTALLLNNASNGAVSDKYNNGSLVHIKRADLVNLSFTGECYDSFTLVGIVVSPSNYYNTPQGGSGGIFNTDLEKWNLSLSNCNSLGFSPPNNANFGTSTQRPNSNQTFTFKMYSCDPNNNPCSNNAIKASGF